MTREPPGGVPTTLLDDLASAADSCECNAEMGLARRLRAAAARLRSEMERSAALFTLTPLQRAQKGAVAAALERINGGSLPSGEGGK